MNRLGKIYNENTPFLGAMLLGVLILAMEWDFTFGEVCIVSSCFYFYLRLKEMILNLK